MVSRRVVLVALGVGVLSGAVLTLVLMDRFLRLQWTSEELTAIGTLVLAATTVAAAVLAWRSARESQRATQTTLFTELLGQYAAPEMLEALRELAHLGEHAQPSLAAFAESWARDIGSSRSATQLSDQVRTYDQYRRLVAPFSGSCRG